MALLSVLALGISQLGSSSAFAHSQHRHHGTGSHAGHAAHALVLQWFDLSKQAVVAAAYPEPVTQSRAWAVSWLGAARAVGDGSRARFQKAAFATALHDALVAQIPSQQATLDAALTSTLAGIRDGRQKSHGVAAGRREASKVLAERAGDGLDTASVDIPYTPPPATPGVWQPTPPTFGPAVRAGQKDGRAFLLKRNDRAGQTRRGSSRRTRTRSSARR